MSTDSSQPSPSVFEQITANIELPDLSSEFRRLDQAAPKLFAHLAIRRAADWLEETLEAEAEMLWEGKKEFHELMAGPLCLPAAYSSHYTSLPLQRCSDMAAFVGDKIITSEALSSVADGLIALAIFDLAHGEVGEFEDDGEIRDPLLAKHVHEQLDLLQEETLAEHEIYSVYAESDYAVERALGLNVDIDASVIEEWFDDGSGENYSYYDDFYGDDSLDL